MVEASSLLAMVLGGAEGRKPFPLSEPEEREAFLEALRKAIDAHSKRAGSAVSETLPYLPLALPQPDLPRSLQTFAVPTGRELPPALFTANPSVPGAAGPILSEAGRASELREALSQAIRSTLEGQGAEGSAGPRLPGVVEPAPREGGTSLAAAIQALLQQKEQPEAGTASELREALSQAIRSYLEDGGRKTEAMDAAQPLGGEANAAAGKRSGFAETLGQRIAELVQAPHPEAGSQSASPNAPPFLPPAPAPAGTAPDSDPWQWLDRPLGHPAWDHALGEQVLRMTGKSLTTAELRLNPPDLGPLEVRIHLNQDRDQASIVFSSQHLAVREAVEAAIPKLREMFGNQQIHLVDVNVSQHSFSEQRQDFSGADDSGAPYAAAGFLEETPMEDSAPSAGADRLLNLYV